MVKRPFELLLISIIVIFRGGSNQRKGIYSRTLKNLRFIQSFSVPIGRRQPPAAGKSCLSRLK
ncbi:hypothetical protein CH238_04310 [[Clostridium] leptum DSM 753]|uniref:Uncharacterized protein n=1 Tax=[Clostridium] leptum DSM 753 TaxID=428125 RepID=A0A855A725_9FIRM|nr:hypothetical protein CH238_04310 [[Clostridium] leptum DSM 753]RGU03936.1 hypothetical protein DWW99_05150 [[Clostridium] leptum]